MNLFRNCGLVVALAGLLGTGIARGETDPNMDAARDTAQNGGFVTNTNRNYPILFIVGDSTAHNPQKTERGWGDVIGRYFNTNKIRVENHALGGRSSRTFITQGWWDKILAAGKPGDFVLIQLGHNDGGALNAEPAGSKYPLRARGTIPGIGEEKEEIDNVLTKTHEVVHTYGWYLRKYISDGRAKGMIPILCSPVPHVPKEEVKAGDVEPSRYVTWSEEVARNEHALFIHLNKIVMSHYTGLTPEQVKTKYFTPADNTHTNPQGADLNAQSVLEGLRQLDCPLKQFVAATPAMATAAK